jgi:Mce-associated membrane protein
VDTTTRPDPDLVTDPAPVDSTAPDLAAVALALVPPEPAVEDPGPAADLPGSIDMKPGAAVGSARLLPSPVVGLLSVLLIIAIVMAGVLGWILTNRYRLDTAQQEALAAAQQYAVTLTSIDADHIDQDLAAVTAGATGDFKKTYAQSAYNLKPLLVQAKSASKGQVLDAAVQSASSNEVVVMLFVDAAITNVTNPTPRVDRNRILMTMDKVSGRWLASKVDLP